ncbi:MAG TPA: hypothetical protein VHV49_12770, partial [Pseudonocardiaceae bacterium]|nr:hypothetical protein [Pseudonocardiaceae bacterium]
MWSTASARHGRPPTSREFVEYRIERGSYIERSGKAQVDGRPIVPVIARGQRPTEHLDMDFSLDSRLRGRAVAVVAAALLAVATTAAVATAATTPNVTTAATVTVNATTGEGTVPSTGLGANTAVYDGFLTDPALPSLLSAAGVKALRYPGGSVSDVYDWQDNSVVPGTSFANPNDNFDNFMKVAQSTGAQPVITVNYGSGTATEAAAWVKYANVTNNYGVKYWEIGNEVYGNGAYGSSWEFDQ